MWYDGCSPIRRPVMVVPLRSVPPTMTGGASVVRAGSTGPFETRSSVRRSRAPAYSR